jgi:hypothetical protein
LPERILKSKTLEIVRLRGRTRNKLDKVMNGFVRLAEIPGV